MFRWVKAPATKPDDLSSIPGPTPEAEKQLTPVTCPVGSLLCYAYTGTRACLHKINKM